MAETLKEKTTIGIIWSFVDKFGQQALYLVSGIILARIITPEEYGLVAVLSVFTAIANTIVDSGFNRGLLNKKNCGQDDFNTVFYFNLIISIFIYILLYLSAPLIAFFFKNESLTILSRVIFLAIPFNALASIQNVILWKNIDLKKQAQAAIIALAFSSISAIIMGLYGFGVWSIVAQNVLFALGKSIVLWILSTWRPTLTFQKRILIEMFPFGSKLLFTGILNSAFNNIYSIIIGLLFPMNQVGYYDRANKYQDMCLGTASNTFRSVAIPLFSEVKDDNERLKRVMSKMVKSTAFFCCPLVGFLIVVAKPLLVILVSDVWLNSVPIFQILCGASLVATFNYIFNESVVAKGRSDIFMGLELCKKGILLLLIYLMVSFGIRGLAYSWAIYSVISLFIALVISARIMIYNMLDFIKDVTPYFIISIVISYISYYLCYLFTNYYIFVISNALVIFLLYLGTCKLFKLDVIKEIQEWTIKYKHK